MPFESNYQDLNDANNPPSSESNEDGNNEGTKEKKKRTIICRRYKERAPKDGVLWKQACYFLVQNQPEKAIEAY